MDWSMFAAIGGLIAFQTTLLLWMMSKLDNDIRSSTADTNAKWMAANARVDSTQAIIMRMLDKQGR